MAVPATKGEGADDTMKSDQIINILLFFYMILLHVNMTGTPRIHTCCNFTIGTSQLVKPQARSAAYTVRVD